MVQLVTNGGAGAGGGGGGGWQAAATAMVVLVPVEVVVGKQQQQHGHPLVSRKGNPHGGQPCVIPQWSFLKWESSIK